MSSAISGFSSAASINQSVSQFGKANKASNSETVRLLDTVSSKVDKAAKTVISTAVDIKSQATQAKGNTINVIV